MYSELHIDKTCEQPLQINLSSKFAYFNSQMAHLPCNLSHKLQMIQNNATLLIFKKNVELWYLEFHPYCMILYWPPVCKCIEFKIATI